MWRATGRVTRPALHFSTGVHKAHLSGHDERIFPIFTELRPYLEAAFDEAAEGEVYVVPCARGGRNLRQYAEQLIERAGVPKWPRLFQNLRSSREVELMRKHPAHVVLLCWRGSAIPPQWLGRTTCTRPTRTSTEPPVRRSCRVPFTRHDSRHDQQTSEGVSRQPNLVKTTKKASSPHSDEEAEYPRQGSLDRCLTRGKRWFSEGCSLNRTLFSRRPSPLAETR